MSPTLTTNDPFLSTYFLLSKRTLILTQQTNTKGFAIIRLSTPTIWERSESNNNNSAHLFSRCQTCLNTSRSPCLQHPGQPHERTHRRQVEKTDNREEQVDGEESKREDWLDSEMLSGVFLLDAPWWFAVHVFKLLVPHKVPDKNVVAYSSHWKIKIWRGRLDRNGGIKGELSWEGCSSQHVWTECCLHGLSEMVIRHELYIISKWVTTTPKGIFTMQVALSHCHTVLDTHTLLF